ncbi:MAG: hypothetical protein DID92_2727743115 [Candidatus Nitrotoga sp. SPKER]|nr:MAG: hypothetical protein DID92_2727743115 [Candidatus Nitrotoga sp. SPKER]
MNKKQLSVRPRYTVGRKYLPMLYVNDKSTNSKFDWDVDEPLVEVVRKYLRYIAHKTFR